MSKILPLTDPSANELLGLATVGFGTLSARLQAEVQAGLGGPVVPPGSIEAQVRAAAAAAGYSTCIYYDWDWLRTGTKFVQTVDDPQGPLGNNGIVVISFKPVPVIASNGSVSVSEYPGGLGADRRTSISTKPCDFSQDSPWTKVGYNQGIQFAVAPNNPSPRTMPMLLIGTQYFLNVANQGTTNQPEMRVSANRPAIV